MVVTDEAVFPRDGTVNTQNTIFYSISINLKEMFMKKNIRREKFSVCVPDFAVMEGF